MNGQICICTSADEMVNVWLDQWVIRLAGMDKSMNKWKRYTRVRAVNNQQYFQICLHQHFFIYNLETLNMRNYNILFEQNSRPFKISRIHFGKFRTFSRPQKYKIRRRFRKSALTCIQEKTDWSLKAMLYSAIFRVISFAIDNIAKQVLEGGCRLL